MNALGPVPSGFEPNAQGRLLIGGRDFEELVGEAQGTPLFVYDRARIEAQVARFRAAFPAEVTLHYAVKANPYAPLLEAMSALIDGFDVASAGELGKVAHLGLPISFAGPGKRDQELETAIRAYMAEALRRMLQAGADRSAIVARLVGGAAMFANLLAPGLIHSGERNVLASRHALHAAGLPLQREWVGEDFGRSVELDLATGRVVASSVRHGARDL